jgi:iron(III) transport system permease protein
VHAATTRRAPRPLVVVAGFSVLLATLPIVYIGVRISEAGPDGILVVLSRPRLPALLVNTVLLAVAVTVTSTVIGAVSAVALTGSRRHCSRLLAVAAVLPLAVPSYLAAFGWLAMFPAVHGFVPCWLVLSFVTAPYVTLPVAAALQNRSRAHSDVARTLGLSSARVLWWVVLPSIRSALLSGALLVFLYTIADFGGVALFRFPVVTTGIQQAYGASFDRNYAAVLSAVLVLIALAACGAGRGLRLRRGASCAASTGEPGVGMPERKSVSTVILLMAPIAVVVIPMISITGRLLGAESVEQFDGGRLASAAVATISLATAGGVIAVLLATPIATLSARWRGRIVSVIETAGSLPLALPGIVVALGLVFFTLNAVPVLYQSTLMLAFAYGVLFLPKAIGVVRSAIDRVPVSLESVARTLGCNPVHTWWRVTARIARPGIVVAGLIVTVSAMKELPATVMLRPTGSSTLATELWSNTTISAYAAAAPYALALLLVAAVPAALLAPGTVRVRIDADR